MDFGSVVVASRCVPLFLLNFCRRCARLLFSLYPLEAFSQIPGAEGAERSEAPEAPRYPYQFSSFRFGADAGIYFFSIHSFIGLGGFVC